MASSNHDNTYEEFFPWGLRNVGKMPYVERLTCKYINYKHTTKEYFHFYLIPIKYDKYKQSDIIEKYNEMYPYNNPKYIIDYNSHHNKKILCKATYDKSDWGAVKIITPPYTNINLSWKISRKNGYIKYFLKTNNVYDNNYKETFLYNKENYYCIKIIYKSLFYNIIKLKVLLKRIRMKIHNKKMAHLFLLSTLDISSKTNIFKPSLFSLTKKNIFKYIV